MAVIAAYDPQDPHADPRARADFGRPKPQSVTGLRIGVPRQLGILAEEVQVLFTRALDGLRRAGAELVEVELPDAPSYLAAVGQLRGAEIGHSLAWALERTQAQLGLRWDELPRVADASLRPIFERLGIFDPKRELSAKEYLRVRHRGLFAVRQAYGQALANVDAVVTPTTPVAAPKLSEYKEMQLGGRRVSSFRTLTRHTLLASVVGAPALSLPSGRTSSGLPTGLQILGHNWRDREVLAIGRAVELLGLK